MNLPTSVAERSQVNVMRATMDIQVKVDSHASGSNEITGTEVRRRDQDPRRQTRASANLDSQTGTTEGHWFYAEHSETPAWKSSMPGCWRRLSK
jgi:hypothetical protein